MREFVPHNRTLAYWHGLYYHSLFIAEKEKDSETDFIIVVRVSGRY